MVWRRIRKYQPSHLPRWMKNFEFIHSRVLFSHKKNKINIVFIKADITKAHHAEWKKPDSERQTDFLKSKFKNRHKIRSSTIWVEEGYKGGAGRRGREGSVGWVRWKFMVSVDKSFHAEK